MIRFKNILYKVAIIESNFITGDRIYNPVMLKEEDQFIYSEFEKILDEKNILGKYIGDPKIHYGDNRTELKVGENFMVWTNAFQSRRTTDVLEIFTPNLFTTKNSLYFIKDEAFQIQMQRVDKLNQIL